MSIFLSDRTGVAANRSLSYSLEDTAALADGGFPYIHNLGARPDSLELWVEQGTPGSGLWEKQDPATYVLVTSTELQATTTTLASVVGGSTNVRIIASAGPVAVSVAEAASGQAGIIAASGSQALSPALTLESDLTVGSDSLFVDVSTGRVGVGNATASHTFSVGSDLGLITANNAIALGSAGNNAFFMGNDTDNRGAIEWRSTEGALRLSTRSGAASYTDTLWLRDGNVGIGTSSPSNPFHAKANLGIPAGLTGTEFLDKSLARFNFETGTGSLYVAAGGSSSVILQCANANGTAAQNVYLQPYGGNVGVGTTNPGDIVEAVGEDAGGRVRYQVRNTSTTAGSTAGYGGEAFNGTGGFFLGMESNSPFDVELRAFQGGADINFYAGGASNPTVVMGASGDVLIGTATNSGNAALQVENSNGGGLAANFYRSTGTDATDLVAMYSDVNTTRGEVWRVEADGDTFGSTGGTYTSDLRVKKNVTPIAYGLEEILQLDPISFNWQQDEEGEIKSFSLGSAQKVQELMPEMVSEDGLEYEIDGVRQKAKAIYGQEVVAVMVKAIQELKAELDAANARIETLEGAN